MSALRQGNRLHVAGDTAADVAARREQRMPHPVRLTEVSRLGTATDLQVPLSELVLVDQHEAQGWRVRQDERLDLLFEERCDWVRTYGRAGQLAVDAGDETLTYDELDARSNQLARYLRLHGASGGDRIALLFDRPTDSYVAVLAVLKIGATYVPLDPGTPSDRLAAMVDDSRARIVLSTSEVVARAPQITQLTVRGAEFVHLDRAAPLIAEQDGRRLFDAERGNREAGFAYITYGADGDGTGVAVDHRSIANFVKVAAEMYGIRPWDRVYQGRSIAVDFSVEEIWVPWAIGATLVPRPAGAPLHGGALHAYLGERRVTALCCEATLLATIDDDLPDVRFLLVSGEACPSELVNRWYRPGRRFVSVYGPPEATVSALWTELDPDRPVTLGVPLPTYSTVILDADDPQRALPHGEVGEIGIAGIGLACGYLGRDDLTEQAFVPDFLGIPANPSGRIYRTGDLGRVTADLEIEYHGRADRRDDLTAGSQPEEIESSLLGPAVDPIAPPAPPALFAPPAPPVAPGPVGPPALFAPPAPPALFAPPAPPVAPGPVGPPALFAPPAPPVAPGPVGPPALFAPPAPPVAPGPVGPPALFAPPAPPVAPGPVGPPALFAPPAPPAPVAPPAPSPAISPAPAALVAPPAPVSPATGLASDLAAVLAEVLGVASVSVDDNFFDDLGADSMVMARFCARLRKRDDLPAVSMRNVYGNPTIAGLASLFAPAPAPTAGSTSADAVAIALAEVLEDVLGAPVPVDGNFFDDLGADSMVMARFCARLRKRDDLPTVSIKDVYANPTAAKLASALAPPVGLQAGLVAASAEPPEPPVITTGIARATRAVRAARHRHVPVRRQHRILCGTLQLLFLLAYPGLQALVGLAGVGWVADAVGVVDVYLRSVVAGAAYFAILCGVPILLKWVLVGRWRAQEIPVWTMAYLRFWIVRTLIQRNPMAMFVGSPLYSFYLRALGAKVGRGVSIFSRNVPVCTDLLRIGDGTVIRKDSFFTGYRAQNGVIQIGAVRLGRDVLVGEATVLDISTRIGDGAQLGHTSSLHTGQVVPAGERWHGSPAQPTEVDYRVLPTTGDNRARRIVFSALQLLNLLAIGLPLGTAVLVVIGRVPQVAALLDAGPLAFTSSTFYAQVLVAATAGFVGFVVVGLLVVITVPRLLRVFVRPDRTYPLYGVAYWAHRAITRLTNLRFFAYLFGDSSYIVGYLQSIGYDLGEVEQTGSNFGQRVKHETPFLSSVGTGTVVADGLSIVNADFSRTSFRVSRASIGAHNFLGNNIAYPSQGRTGDNCLLATKVMVPIDGPVRENVGLLGSPSFEIPRSVQRDVGLELGSPEEMRRQLRAKNRHNLVTIALFLLVRWVYVVMVVLAAAAAADLYHAWGIWAILPANAAVLLLGIVYFVLVERTVAGLEALVPDGCSIYDRTFWRHERFWKVPVQAYLPLLNGTPLKTGVWRMLGVRMGRRVFDDGCAFVEKSFVTVGDDCTLNAGSIVQCHSQEDGAFKSDRTALGAGVTLGVGAFVHYGVTMGDRSVLAADSFLMKGEDVPADATWGGNPARKMREFGADLRVRRINLDEDGAGVLVHSA